MSYPTAVKDFFFNFDTASGSWEGMLAVKKKKNKKNSIVQRFFFFRVK